MARAVARGAVRAAVFLALLEGGARALLSFDAVLDRVRTDGDTWFRLDWVRRHRSGVEVYYGFDVFDPRLGWRSKPNLRDQRVFGDRTLNTNSHGFRGRTEYGLEKAEGRKRILVLGDSYTFGDEVSDGETYPHLLQESLPGVEVLNLGVHGYGHDQMLLLLQQEGMSYRPDVVILGFVYIDVLRNGLAFNDYAKPRFELHDGDLVLTNVPVPEPARLLADQAKRSRLVDVFAMLSEAIRARRDRGHEREMAVSVRILDEIVRVSREGGAIPLLAALPIQWEANDVSDGPLDSERFLLDYCQGRAVDCASLRPYFREKVLHGHTFREQAGGHWFPDGHQTVAAGLRTILTTKGLPGP